jgi:coronin-1B/1C/6
MSRFVRASKVRHLYCQPQKKEETYTHLRLSTATGDHQYIKANSKYWAVSYHAGGGGTLLVVPHGKYGALKTGTPMISGHHSAVLDFDWNPFNDNIIATGSDDCTVKLWSVPDGGLTETMKEPILDIDAHMRKVVFTTFHPAADNVLATASADCTVKIWDVEAGECRSELAGHGQSIQDLKWSYDGSLIASSCKDKKLRVFDARVSEAIASVQPHEGSKCSKCCWLGKDGNLVTTGFTRQSKRQFRIWDPRKLDKQIVTIDIDQAAGVIMPTFDEDTNVLYLAGKGDGNIRFYEIVKEAPHAFLLSEYRSSTSQKGMCFLPKRHCDVLKCETARAMKLTSNTVEPLSFIIPRKSDHFQADIFPDTYAGVPAMNSDEYFEGENKVPPLVSLNPKNGGKISSGDGSGAAPVKKRKTAAQLQKELDAANARIAELEAEVAKLKA